MLGAVFGFIRIITTLSLYEPDEESIFTNLETTISSVDLLFQLWCEKNTDMIDEFIKKFAEKYNVLAEKNNLLILKMLHKKIRFISLLHYICWK